MSLHTILRTCRHYENANMEIACNSYSIYHNIDMNESIMNSTYEIIDK